MEGGKSQFARYFSSRKDTAYTEDLAYLEVYGRCEVCAGSFIRKGSGKQIQAVCQVCIVKSFSTHPELPLQQGVTGVNVFGGGMEDLNDCEARVV